MPSDTYDSDFLDRVRDRPGRPADTARLILYWRTFPGVWMRVRPDRKACAQLEHFHAEATGLIKAEAERRGMDTGAPDLWTDLMRPAFVHEVMVKAAGMYHTLDGLAWPECVTSMALHVKMLVQRLDTDVSAELDAPVVAESNDHRAGETGTAPHVNTNLGEILMRRLVEAARKPPAPGLAPPDLEAELASHQMQPGGGAATKATPKNLLDWAGDSEAIIAIVHTDITGSTEMCTLLGNQKMKELLDVHFTQARHLAEKTGGYLFKTVGDGSFAAFRTTSDALWFALELRGDPGDARLHIRAGVHVGTVIISEHDADGTAMNYTARVLDEARPANICLSNEAKKQIDELGDHRLAIVTFTKRPNCRLKDIQEVQTLWFAEAAKPSRTSSSQGSEFAKPKHAAVRKSIAQWLWSFIKAGYGFTVEKVAKGTTDSITKRP